MVENPRFLVQNTGKFLSTITVARVIYCASSLSPSSWRDEKRAQCCLSMQHLGNLNLVNGLLEKCPPSPVEREIILFYQNTGIIYAKEERNVSLSSLSWSGNKPGVLGNGRYLSYHGIQKKSENVSCSVLSDSLRPLGLQLARLLCPWSSPGKNTGMDSQSLLHGIFLTHGSNPGLLHWQADSLLSEQPGKPIWNLGDTNCKYLSLRTIFLKKQYGGNCY